MCTVPGLAPSGSASRWTSSGCPAVAPRGTRPLPEGTLARSLLSTAIDDADPDPHNVVAVLDEIDGTFARAQLGIRQAKPGTTVALDEL